MSKDFMLVVTSIVTFALAGSLVAACVALFLCGSLYWRGDLSANQTSLLFTIDLPVIAAASIIIFFAAGFAAWLGFGAGLGTLLGAFWVLTPASGLFPILEPLPTQGVHAGYFDTLFSHNHLVLNYLAQSTLFLALMPRNARLGLMLYHRSRLATYDISWLELIALTALAIALLLLHLGYQIDPEDAFGQVAMITAYIRALLHSTVACGVSLLTLTFVFKIAERKKS